MEKNEVLLVLFFIAVPITVFFLKNTVFYNNSKFDKGNESNNNILYFKDNISAFEYACKYLNNDIQPNKAITGIVIDKIAGIKTNYYYVQYANTNNISIVIKKYSEIINNNEDTKYIIKCEALEHVPLLEIKDLVLLVHTTPKFFGLIVEKVEPCFDLNNETWKQIR